MATFEDFDRLEMRVGVIVDVLPFPEARKPAFKLRIDFGPEIGVKNSSAQITVLYSPENLVGKRVVAVTNFAPKQIGPFLSEVLTLGVADANGDVVLLQPERDAPLGSRVY